MALTIKVQRPKFLKAKEALLVSFPYNMDTIAKIKSLPVRHYVSAEKAWEVPMKELENVVQMFPDQELKLFGKVTTKIEEKIQKTIVLDTKDVSGFKFKTTPFDHQVESFDYAKDKNKFLLGDEQGLGKTKQTIDIAVSRKHQFKHCLIVCGVNSLKHNWMKEIRIHSDEAARILGGKIVKGKFKEGSTQDRLDDLNRDLKEFFLITNVETLRSKEFAEKVEELTENGTIGMVIIDEIHKCKNPSSQQGKAIHKLKSFYRIAATGTPLMNKPIDLYNVMKWLDVERHSFYQFRNRYCVMGGYGGYEIVGYKNLEELQKRLAENMLRRKKADVLDLPPKIRSIEYVEMTEKQKQLYKEVKFSIEANLDEIKLNPNPLTTLIRLRQVTGAPSILSSKITESAKIERLKEIIEELAESGQKAIVFSNWEEMTKIAKEELKEYNPAYITGSVDLDARSEAVDRFQSDDRCKVIIGTIGAMGTGLTLTAASTVIFLDKPWNMANTEQAEDRAHRIGTTGTVNVITLVAKDTIDERIEEIIESKGDMADALVDGNFEKMDQLQLLQHLLS